ncbi:MAG: hypothetical protein WAW41_07915 [Methylobacter sp.]
MNAIDAVQAVEDVIKQFPQVDIETRHYFAGGVYEREILVPAGTMITGKIHLTEHLAKLVSGTLRIWSEHDQGVFTGPVTFVSQPGAKRVGYAETDVVFSTFHAVGDKTDIEEIEQALVVDTIDQYAIAREKIQMQLNHEIKSETAE